MNLRCDCAVMATGRRSASLLGEKFARLDPQLHPVTSSGAVIALNVFVAGSVVQSGDGDSGNVSHILTGYRAGNLAASTRGNHAAR